MIQVLIAEPYKITRECLRTFLERERDIHVLGEADGLDKAVSLTRELSPDVVLLDVDLHHSKRLEMLYRIMAQPTSPAVVLLAPVEDLAMKREFIKAGLKGYYCWNAPLSEILEAIRAVYSGKSYSSQGSRSISMQCSPVPVGEPGC